MNQPNPFKMLAELPAHIPLYWLAYQRLQDPQQRSDTYWQHLYETDPDRFAEEQSALIAQYKTNSQARQG